MWAWNHDRRRMVLQRQNHQYPGGPPSFPVSYNHDHAPMVLQPQDHLYQGGPPPLSLSYNQGMAVPDTTHSIYYMNGSHNPMQRPLQSYYGDQMNNRFRDSAIDMAEPLPGNAFEIAGPLPGNAFNTAEPLPVNDSDMAEPLPLYDFDMAETLPINDSDMAEIPPINDFDLALAEVDQETPLIQAAPLIMRPPNRRNPYLDDLLVRKRNEGYTYAEILKMADFGTASASTLRGRYRTLTTPKERRPRKPEFSEEHVSRSS